MPEEEKKEESKPEPKEASPPAIPENKLITLSLYNTTKNQDEDRDIEK